VSQVLDPVAAGREAHQRHAWKEAYELLSNADQASALGAEDLELLADAAMWSGKSQENLEATERAFRARMQAGERRRGALLATMLAHHHKQMMHRATAQGWLAQAEEILDQEAEETVEHGWLAIQKALFALGKGDLDAVLEYGREAARIGKAFGDRNVEVIGIQRQGLALIEKGEVEQGQRLLDLASNAARQRELDPFETVVVYCNTIGSCRDRADYARAFEYSDIASDFCAEQGATTGFPGICRVNRAEVMRHRGQFEDAEAEARSAAEELRTFHPRVAGEALNEIGEIKLRLGRLDEAAEAFDQAHEFGHEPQPGVALLRLAEGKVDAAAGSIRNALTDDSMLPLARARLLPAAVEIACAAGDVERARAAKDDLVEIARTYDTEALVARASWARGVLDLADGEFESALNWFRFSFRRWYDDVNAPYEAARVRVWLARALRAAGDEDTATRELRAARKEFEKLGASLDAQRTAELLGVDTGRELTGTFMFTDIVDSTRWAGEVNEEKWRRLLRTHNDIVEAAIKDGGGTVVKIIGDGFFAAFDSPTRAIEAAVAVQRMVGQSGLPFDVRIGVHTATATVKDGDYEGRGIHAAARVGALAGAAEIVATADTVGDGTRFPVVDRRSVSLKGFEEQAEVVTIDWRPT
jgi:class 3 adenylate cyclase